MLVSFIKLKFNICYTQTLQFSLKFISFLLHLFRSIWIIIRLLEENHWKYLIERKYHDYQKGIFLISVIETNLIHTNVRSLLSLFYKSYQRYLIKKGISRLINQLFLNKLRCKFISFTLQRFTIYWPTSNYFHA